MLIDLSEDEIDLILKAVESRHNDLITANIDWGCDNEEEQDKCVTLKNKLKEEIGSSKRLREAVKENPWFAFYTLTRLGVLK